MLGWLKDRLRRWLGVAGPAGDDPWLEVALWTTDKGLKTHRLLVTGAVGLGLAATGEDGSSRLVFDYQAADPAKFLRLWRKHNEGEELYWEDGTPFRPGA